jgi:hypothetical protein
MRNTKTKLQELTRKESFRKNVIYFLIVGIIFFTTVLYKSTTKNEILNDFDITKGKIVDFFIVGVENYRYIQYEFVVNNNKYRRKISINTKKYDLCTDNIENCSDKIFWVIYSPENPKKNMINLNMEIQGLDNPKFPDELDNFK